MRSQCIWSILSYGWLLTQTACHKSDANVGQNPPTTWPMCKFAEVPNANCPIAQSPNHPTTVITSNGHDASIDCRHPGHHHWQREWQEQQDRHTLIEVTGLQRDRQCFTLKIKLMKCELPLEAKNTETPIWQMHTHKVYCTHQLKTYTIHPPKTMQNCTAESHLEATFAFLSQRIKV